MQSLLSNLLEQEERKKRVWNSQEEGVLANNSPSRQVLLPLVLLAWASRLFIDIQICMCRYL